MHSENVVFCFTQNSHGMPKQRLQAVTSRPVTPFFHTRKGEIMRASVLARIRKERPSKKGEAAVFLQIIINSKPTTIPLKISWPVEFFDNKSGIFLSRHKNDQMASDYNLQVNKEIGKVNEIFMFYRHSDANLTIEQFHKEVRNYGARKNFLVWARNDIEERYADGLIEKQSWKNDLTALNKIEKYKPVISFAEFDREFFEKLQAWIINKEGLAISTAWRYIQTVMTYIKRAEEKGISINIRSVNEYTMPSYKGRMVFCKPIHLEKLKKYYNGNEIPEHQHRVLGQFLFSCSTGLRFSDIERVSWKDIIDDTLVFTPYKTRKLQKVVSIPLEEYHFQYFQSNKGLLFQADWNQTTNRVLKEIASACEIRLNLTTHVARHTFATEFLRKGGRVEVLQQLMGHKKIETTMQYVHVDGTQLREQMKIFIGEKSNAAA